MKKRCCVIAGLLSLATAASAGPHGIEPGDINRDGSACNDFFDYANGTWRRENAIPDYMDRWSRRWQSGEVNKEHVRGILDEVSARRDWPVGSAEQLSGDFYGACMDEGRVNEAGIAPVQTLLDEIGAIKTADRRAAHLSASLHAIGVDVGFGLLADQDLHDPTQMIAHVYASGLGLPDRDYYFKPDDRFVEARAKYHEHLVQMFVLAGSTPEAADAAAISVFELEKRFAEATLDNVASRDPASAGPQDEIRRTVRNGARFRLGRATSTPPGCRAPISTSPSRSSWRHSTKNSRKRRLSSGGAIWPGTSCNTFADSLSAPFVEQDFAFYGRYLSGATEMKPRWKRCAEATDKQLGEALGRAYVEKYFPPEAKARMQEMVRNIQLAMHDTIEGLDWMGPATKAKAQEKLATFNAKAGLPGQVEGLRRGHDRSRLVFCRRGRGHALEHQ